jgi:hypothetical protein
MRFLKWALALCVVVVLAVVVGVQFFLNPAVEKLRPVIISKAEELLKTPIGLGSITASVFPSTRIEIRDAMLGGAAGATISRIFVDTDIKQILSGEIAVKKVEVESPVIRITKDKSGTISVGEFRLPAADASGPKDKTSTGEAGSAAAGSPPQNLEIESIRISGINVYYSDASLPQAVEFKDGEFQLSSFSLNRETPFSLKLSLFGSVPLNIAVSGKFLAKSFLSGKPQLNLNIEPSTISLEKLSPFAPSIKLAGDLAVKGEASLRGDDLSSTISIRHNQGSIDLPGASPISLTEFQTTLKTTTTSLVAEALSFKVNGELVETSGKLAEMKDGALLISPDPIRTLGGSVKVQSELATATKAINGSVAVNSLDIGRAQALATGKTNIRGTLEGLTLTYSGQSDALNKTLNANFNAKLVGGEILGVNIFSQALAGLKGIPGLSEALTAYVPEQFRPLLTAENTAFDLLALEGSVTGGNLVNLRNLEVHQQAFLINGSGSLQPGGPIDLRTQMRLTRQVTEGMIAKANKLKLLLDQDGQMTFPLKISGQMSSPVVVPDSSELVKNAARGAAKDVAQKALEKLAPKLSERGFKLNFGL